MKDRLPDKHGLAGALLESELIHRSDGKPSLTDAQYAGLESGVAQGKSILLVAPTSSGKTEVGLLGVASWLAKDPMKHRAVYLVSHRALARQKFNLLKDTKYLKTFGLESNELAVSNGDFTLDGNGHAPDDPLESRFLIATYEKFLALLAASGLRQDMSHYCIVADEFQLIADKSRGQDLEVLFTIIRQAKFGQFIGLSAVLDERDLTTLSDWLQATKVICTSREVPLQYELRTPTDSFVWRTDGPEDPEREDPSEAVDVIEMLSELEAESPDNFPVAVFCMTKGDVERLAKQWADVRGVQRGAEPVQADQFVEPTALSEALAVYMPHGIGLHTADLIEGEKEIVERALDRDALAVVFATTTLAQGLNYSFRTVIFGSWARWNGARRQREPIGKGDFHNISGRAGRLGKIDDDQFGRVIFCAKNRAEQEAALLYLDSEIESIVTGKIDPNRIDQLALQLLSSGLIRSSEGLLQFLQESLTGFIAKNNGVNQDAMWQERLDGALKALVQWGFIRE